MSLLRSLRVLLKLNLIGLLLAPFWIHAVPAYETETWPEARTLVWARPGENGAFGDPTNWLENGRPATTAPDRETDIVLPAADQVYRVNALPNEELRHLTVEKNGYILGQHRNDLQVWGNVWIKDGGWVQFVACRGPKNTFFRMDNAIYPTLENGLTFLGGMGKAPTTKPHSRARISHKFEIAKYGDASVEFIGNIGVGDEIMVQYGKCIISGDLRWSGVTDKGAIEVFDGAILELQSGGSISSFINTNAKHVYNINLYRGATLQGGSPQRPLTSDAYVRLGFGPNTQPGDTGLYAAEGSVIRVYSHDPKKARLVFTSITGTPDYHDGKGQLVSALDTPAHGTDGIVLRLAGDVLLDGVFFDYVSESGIRLADLNTRKQWRNVTFGSHNAAPTDNLFAPLDVDGNVYYHNRNDGNSEFALTTKARQTMTEFMNKSDPYQLSVSPDAVMTGNDGASFEKPLSVIFKHPIAVTFATELKDAAIHYTTDGSEVTRTSPQFSGPITIDQTTRFNLRAYAPGQRPSPKLTVTYVFEKE